MAQDESTTDELLARFRNGRRALADGIEPILRERPTMEHVLLVLFLIAGLYMYWGAREFSATAAEFPQIMAGTTAILSFLILVRNYLNVVVPIMAAGLGAYAVYTGTTTFLAGDGGLVRVILGVLLFVAVVGFRRQLVDSAESFIAEPMQVLGKDDILGEDKGEGTETPDTEGTSDEEEADTEDTSDEEKADTEGTSDEEEADSGAMYVYEIDDPKGPIVTGLLCAGYMGLTFAIGMLYATPVFVATWALWVGMDFSRGAALTGLGMLCSYLFYDVIQSDISEGWLTDWQPTPPDVLYAQYVEQFVPLLLEPGSLALGAALSTSTALFAAAVGVPL